jgi:hypothetical protein
LGARLGLGNLFDHAELAVAGVVDGDVEGAEVVVRCCTAAPTASRSLTSS